MQPPLVAEHLDTRIPDMYYPAPSPVPFFPGFLVPVIPVWLCLPSHWILPYAIGLRTNPWAESDQHAPQGTQGTPHPYYGRPPGQPQAAGQGFPPVLNVADYSVLPQDYDA